MSYQISFKDFLKKFSSVNNKFIDDFFSHYSENTKDTDFVIDFDNTAKWLQVRKDSIKRTLIESYRNNIDYKITEKKLITAGRPSEKILITPDCFKRICLLTKSVKGEAVRSYYIQLEKHLDKYKDNIINDLRKENEVLRNDLKPLEIPKDTGVIYVLKTDNDVELKDIYKIGSTTDFKSRLLTHQSSHVHNVKVEYVYNTNDVKGVERCLKAILRERQYRKRKEFYQIDIDDLKEIIDNCGNSLSLLKKTRTAKSSMSGGGSNNYFVMLLENE
jgi:phage anti-repressor protein/predicted GIY-YIG superfamily endonuclease